MNPGRLIALSFASLLVALPAQYCLAQLGDDVRGSADHPLLSRFPDSQIIAYETAPDSIYQLVLGNLRRAGGQVVPERVEQLRGNLTRITYEIPQTYNGENVFDFFREQAQEGGYTTLFECSGRGCGNSNYWANTLFNNRILYGPERNQYFMALDSTANSGVTSHMAVYVNTRANRRLYAHIEIVEGDSAAATPVSEFQYQRLIDYGSLRVTDITFSEQDQLEDERGIIEVLQLLQEYPELRVYIVAHLDGTAPLDQLLARSLARANQIRSRLVSEGVDPDRISAQGVGPLAPGCDTGNCARRIEIVAIQ